MKHNSDTKALFELIDKLRMFKGLQKKQLAAAAEITPQYYSELLTGDKTPSIAIVFRLLQVLDCELKPVFKV